MSKAEPEGPYVYQPYGVFEQPYAQDGRIYGVGGIDPPIRGVNKWLAEAIAAAIREAVEAERKAILILCEEDDPGIEWHHDRDIRVHQKAAADNALIWLQNAIKARSNTRTSDKSSRD